MKLIEELIDSLKVLCEIGEDISAKSVMAIIEKYEAEQVKLDDMTAQRLRGLLNMIGLGDAVPNSDTELMDVLFSVLGMIRRKFEEKAKPAACVPDGWKLVPIEMTDDQAWAVEKAANCYGGSAADIYREMLSATPQPPVQPPIAGQPKIGLVAAFDDGEEVWLSSHTGGAHKDGSFAELSLTFNPGDGSPSYVRCYRDINLPAKMGDKKTESLKQEGCEQVGVYMRKGDKVCVVTDIGRVEWFDANEYGGIQVQEPMMAEQEPYNESILPENYIANRENLTEVYANPTTIAQHPYAYEVPMKYNQGRELAFAKWFHNYGNKLPDDAIPLYTRPAPSPEVARDCLDFVSALHIAELVFAQYKVDQFKWWKRMDGTPIFNDISVRMANAFLAAIEAQKVGGKNG